LWVVCFVGGVRAEQERGGGERKKRKRVREEMLYAHGRTELKA